MTPVHPPATGVAVYPALFCFFLDVKFVATSHIGIYLNIKVQLSFTRPHVEGLSKIMPLLSWDSKLYVCLLGGHALLLGGTLQRCTTVCWSLECKENEYQAGVKTRLTISVKTSKNSVETEWREKNGLGFHFTPRARILTLFQTLGVFREVCWGTNEWTNEGIDKRMDEWTTERPNKLKYTCVLRFLSRRCLIS